MIVHVARITFDFAVLRTAFDDLEIFAQDTDVGAVSATGPFLAVGAVAQGREHGLAGILVLDGGTQAGTFCHFWRTDGGIC